MNPTIKSGLRKYGRFTVYFIFFALSFSMELIGNVFAAYAGEPVSFSWRANPPEDNVIGYRLYYGSASRFRPNGIPKADFSYDYYIDLSTFERCVPGRTGMGCEMLNSDEIECSNLSGNSPRCTLYNLQSQLYFALTAYNAQAESAYTRELPGVFGAEVLGVLQHIYVLLLEKEK
jgi:hypothetical protein